MTPSSMEESYLRERISREEARQEFYAEISQRLGEKELFILLHLINRRAAYQQMMKAVNSDGEQNTFLADVDDSDTVTNIAAATKVGYTQARMSIYALHIVGLVEDAGMKNNAHAWRVTSAGGQVVKKAIEMEDKRKKSLEQRFTEKTKKR